MSDDAPTPPSSPGPDGQIVQSAATDWARRARAAAECADALRAADRAVTAVAAANHFGECTEGSGMQSALIPALHEWQTQLAAQAAHLTDLARSCAAAHTTFVDTDHQLAGGASE
ncbi:hypothetical protein AAFP30_19745 [Gordonia sp. CPCC 205515]|uniref:hypothetical protein n=1 Tax=Gordonia sp. CPCC 205515 TaxID=3140791 RepID=UPI003AF3CDEA